MFAILMVKISLTRLNRYLLLTIYDSIMRCGVGVGGHAPNKMTVNQNLTKFTSAGRWIWQNPCRLSGPVFVHHSLSKCKSN